MTNERPLSRREMLRGRFLPGIIGPLVDEASRESAAPSIRSTADTMRVRDHMVMRYPTTTDDVDAAPSRSTPAQRHRHTIPIHRPPGAVDEQTFLADCTRCDECLTACPHDAIVHAPPRFREATGTPMIDADRQPCRMCDDLPCIEACAPDVLSHLVATTMGTARITPQTCLAYQGTTCTVCSEHCPVDDAISVTAGRPVINESTCTGCGVCRYVCPSPSNAILQMPMFVRPTRPAPEGDRHA